MLLRRYHKKRIEPIKNEKEIKEPTQRELLEGLNVKQLIKLAREHEIGYGGLKKAELIDELLKIEGD